MVLNGIIWLHFPRKLHRKFRSKNLVTKLSLLAESKNQKSTPFWRWNHESIHPHGFFPPKNLTNMGATYYVKHAMFATYIFQPLNVGLRGIFGGGGGSTQLPASGMAALASLSSRSARRCITPSWGVKIKESRCHSTHRISIYLHLPTFTK